jgi:hypothetical protein
VAISLAYPGLKPTPKSVTGAASNPMSN